MLSLSDGPSAGSAPWPWETKKPGSVAARLVNVRREIVPLLRPEFVLMVTLGYGSKGNFHESKPVWLQRVASPHTDKATPFFVNRGFKRWVIMPTTPSTNGSSPNVA
jgi:hypothetical protein